jgi:hypothetical protein
MTIAGPWSGVCKNECPDAFTEKLPPQAKTRVGYIDGMPALMMGKHCNSWASVVGRFSSIVKKMFLTCNHVVLAFDCYDLVSEAKGITQSNRAKVSVPVVFNEGDQLPSIYPMNYNDLIRNRTFKALVIEKICDDLADMVGLEGSKRLIIDYKGCPVMFRRVTTLHSLVGPVEMVEMPDMPAMGEADVKFIRWSRLYGNMIAHSVDGDFLLIALLEYERALVERLDESVPPSNIYVYRISYKLKDSVAKPTKRKGAPGAYCITFVDYLHRFITVNHVLMSYSLHMTCIINQMCLLISWNTMHVFSSE